MGKLKDAMLGEEQERDVDAEYESWRDQQMFDEIEIHKKFSESRLRSYYIANPRLMCPAITMLREAKGLLADKHYSACVVFQALLAKALALSAWRAGTQGRLAYRRGRGFFISAFHSRRRPLTRTLRRLVEQNPNVGNGRVAVIADRAIDLLKLAGTRLQWNKALDKIRHGMSARVEAPTPQCSLTVQYAPRGDRQTDTTPLAACRWRRDVPRLRSTLGYSTHRVPNALPRLRRTSAGVLPWPHDEVRRGETPPCRLRCSKR